MWSDGQYLIHCVYDLSIKGVVPLRFELIEFDQIDTLIDGVLSKGNISRRGIEIESGNGRPVAFHVLDHHPGDDNATGRRGETWRISAFDIIHVWDRYYNRNPRKGFSDQFVQNYLRLVFPFDKATNTV